MVKFTGESQTLAFNSGSSGTNFCVTGIDYNFDGDVYKAACAGASGKQTIVGQDDFTAAVNVLIEKQALDDVFGASGTFIRGAEDSDWVHNPEGAGAANPTITSTRAVVVNYSLGVQVEGLVGATINMAFDDLTVGALGA